MIRFIKILFLGLSILFSFGFTTYESSCNSQITQNIDITAGHSCCHPEKKINVTSNACTKSNKCKADCCLHLSNILVFNDFIFNESILYNTDVVLERFLNIDYKLYEFTSNIYFSKLDNYQYLSSKNSCKQRISLKQSWLI
jgi:hypothetical protein